MNVKPLYDHVLLKVLEAEDTTESGIVLTGSASVPRTRAKVIAVGSGRLLQDGSTVALAVEEGDTVVIGQHAEMQIEVVDGEEYHIARESSILAVVHNPF